MTPREARDIIHNACPGPRIDWVNHQGCTIYEGHFGNSAESILRALQDTGHVTRGNAGYEYLRALGQVQHVYAVKLGPVSVRILSSPISPRGQFTNLAALERRIKP